MTDYGLDDIAEVFGKGVRIEVGDLVPSSKYADLLQRVPQAWEKAFEINASEDEARPGFVCRIRPLPACIPWTGSAVCRNTDERSTKPDATLTPKNQSGACCTLTSSTTPKSFPSPTQPPPDFISPLMNQMLAQGQHARAKLTKSWLGRSNSTRGQFKNLGPSLDQVRAILEERKRQILATYENANGPRVGKTDVQKADQKDRFQLNEPIRTRLKTAAQEEQLYDFERIYWSINDDTSPGNADADEPDAETV